MIRVKNLYLRYTREFYALYNINMEIEDGESVALVGEMKVGKQVCYEYLQNLKN